MSEKVKLTKAREKALRFFAEHDGSKLFPVGIANVTLERLVMAGLLRREMPPFGFSRHFITDLGRAALRSDGGNDG